MAILPTGLPVGFLATDIMTNFEYLKTLNLKDFAHELCEHFRDLDFECLEKYLNKEKVFCTDIIGYIVCDDDKYIHKDGFDTQKFSNYLYVHKSKLTKDELFDFVRNIAVYCKFALITCMENSIEHHLVVHDGMWSDELVRNFE